jgi:WS/DGAT/MGAT family acyltransferase
MSPADSAWLRMENPSNPMTITGLIGFRGTMSLDSMRAFMAERVVPLPRFQMRVQGHTSSSPRWVPDPSFSIADHVESVELPEPGGKAGLEALVSELMSTPLSFEHSPWRIDLVETVDDGDGKPGSAAIIRVHHCIGDGIGLMHVLMSAADESFDPETLPGGRPTKPRKALHRRVGGIVRGAFGETIDLLTSPRHLGSRLSSAGAGTKSLAGLLLMRPDSQTLFKGQTTPDKRAAWTRPFPLDAIKEVLLAAASGALRRYLDAHGQPTDDIEIRAAVPFNVRPLERAHELGNSFGLVFLLLPISLSEPVARLKELKRRMDDIKGSADPAVTYGILQSIGRAPGWTHRMVVKMFSEKASAVMTNVPGPPDPIHIMDVPIETLMFWVPQAGDIGLGLSILSTNGSVRVGVCTDASSVPNPSQLTDAFEAEFAALAERYSSPLLG